MTARYVALAFLAGALALDQATKALVLASLEGNVVELLPIFDLVLVRNDGVSFGMLSGVVPPWALAALALLIVGMLLAWLWRSQSCLVGAALGLIVGGALGNAVDRIRHGAVTDFLDFHAGSYHWPAFNFADVTIFCGVALLLAESFIGGRTPEP